MNNTDQRYPRPKPRFAGLADVVLVAVDAVATGWSEGEIGLVAGGIVLLIVNYNYRSVTPHPGENNTLH